MNCLCLWLGLIMALGGLSSSFLYPQNLCHFIFVIVPVYLEMTWAFFSIAYAIGFGPFGTTCLQSTSVGSRLPTNVAVERIESVRSDPFGSSALTEIVRPRPLVFAAV